MTVKLHIGLDDTDSPRAGCTTYIAALIIRNMRKLGIPFIDYPSLIRLNPNVPWKTRGNGAICLRIVCEEQMLGQVEECVVEPVEEQADLSFGGTDPGVVFLTGEVPGEIEAFSQRTISGLVRKDEALRLIRKFGAEAFGFKDGRGIIGALAAIGEMLKGDHTYEFIAYRKPRNRGTPRRIDASSVISMEKELGNLSFNNVDPETGRILITPRGPDPILYGIRGESAEAVRCGHELVVAEEPIERWVVFRTNQGTDAHLKRIVSISQVKPYNPIVIEGQVVGKPRVLKGGHVVFRIRDETGETDCAAYEPTGILRNVAKSLVGGDVIEACGGVRPASSKNPITVNLEKMRIVKLGSSLMFRNPLCPKCGRRMKSMGRNQGFECKNCGFHGPNLEKTVVEAERPIKPGVYVTSPRSQRHLTKPLKRYGLEKPAHSESYEKVIPYDLFSGS